MQVLRRIVSQPLVLASALLSVLTMAGCGGGSSSPSGTNVTATPTFSPGAGSYNTSQTVTIADSTPGAVLYCTTDGTTPTTSSPQCSQPTTVFKTQFLQAIAVAPNKSPSPVASAGYTINLNAAATPTFSPAGGSYTSAQTVSVNDATAGANIYYTTDGSVPNASSTLYTGPITLSKTTTLSALAVASGFANSGVASASYVIGTGTASPVISPAGGTFTSAQSVTITDASSGASIYYTVDGSVPTSSSTPYSGPFNVSATETITAIAIAAGSTSSPATASFVINIPVAAAPTFNPAAGTYSSTQTVMLADTTVGATIYYTLDGSTPTTSASVYNGGINVATSETIKAIATAPGFATSAVSSAAYTINLPVAPPTFNPAAGTYTSAQSVTISDATAGATIYYTLDGSTPTTSSQVFSTPITVSSPTVTVSAIAAVGSAISPVATAAYTINLGPSLSGKVMSGTLPVNGAKVQMYAAGNTGYASSATLLTAAAVATGSDGSFTLNYNCPGSPGDLVYLVATGGHTGSNSGDNAGLALMAALGSCNGTLPTSLVVNEATTVASAYALAQFMTGAANVGSASSQQSTQGISNAFKTVNNLVDLTTGTVRDHTPDYPTNLAGDPKIFNNSTVPQARINTLANVLNLCAVDGGGCNSLFSAATVASGAAPTDTLQSILNIAQNPGNQASIVFNVAPTGPFTPVLAAPPNDWTLALTFTGGGLGFAPTALVPFTNGQSVTGQFINTAMAIDATGNIWVTGFNAHGNGATITPDPYSGLIAEFNNQGKALMPPSSLSSDGTTATYGGYIALNPATNVGGNGPPNGGTQAPHGIAFDPSGNAWVLGGTTSSGVAGPGFTGVPSGALMTEISPALSVTLPFVTLTNTFPTPLTIDGVGNIWTQAKGGLNEFDNTGKMISSNTGKNAPGSKFGYTTLQQLIFDSNATSLWASDSDGFGDLFQINPTNNTATVDYFQTATGVYTPLVAGAALPDGSAGNVYGCASGTGTSLNVFNVSSTSILNSYPIPTGRKCGNQMVMDGAGHIFTVTGSTGTTLVPGIIDEFSVTSSGLTMISPTTTGTGYTGTSSGESPTINPDPKAMGLVAGAISTKGVTGTAIDGSGNLWILNNDSGTSASPGNALVEFIGIAAPVVTPTSLAIQFGQVGVRP